MQTKKVASANWFDMSWTKLSFFFCLCIPGPCVPKPTCWPGCMCKRGFWTNFDHLEFFNLHLILNTLAFLKCGCPNHGKTCNLPIMQHNSHWATTASHEANYIKQRPFINKLCHNIPKYIKHKKIPYEYWLYWRSKQLTVLISLLN